MTEVANWSVKIYTSWKRYKKLIPAAIGVALLILLKQLDIDLPGFASIVVDWLIGSATVFGVYQVKNVFLALIWVIDLDGVTFNGDSTLTFQIHIV